MDIQKIRQFLVDNKQPVFRSQQIAKAIFRDGVSSFAEISTLPKALRENMAQELPVLSFGVEKILVSKQQDSAKALLRLQDGQLIETVLLSPLPGSWSVCISCQVGCQMGCRFCATGQLGFVRNLSAEEITDQVLFWRQYLKNSQLITDNKQQADVSNIVYMGMGEPFNNWEQVAESIKNLTDPTLFGFGARSLSVSTAGIATGILRLAKEFPQVNLAISLHFANDAKREHYMPVNKTANLAVLKTTLQQYFQLTKRKVFLEYIMLENINDTLSDVRELAAFVRSIGNTHLLHVNLIRYNTTSDQLRPSSKLKTQIFKQELEKQHLHATIRKSMGEEIKGACGQLAAH